MKELEGCNGGGMEKWNNGMMEWWNNWSRDSKTLYDDEIVDRKNLNRGFKKLRVWQDGVSLYVLATKVFSNFPFELKKSVSNSLDAVHSISRNIAEGYCRRSLKEYLNHLNIALGSCGEFHSCYETFRKADQISEADYEKLDQLHYKVENELIRLIVSLQKKRLAGDWEDTFGHEDQSRSFHLSKCSQRFQHH